LLLSLWLPWYSFQIPASVLDQAEQAGSQFGALAPLIQQGAEVMRQLGPQHLTAWDVFHQIDVALAIAGVVAAGLAGLALTGRATGVSPAIAVAGAVAASLIIYRLGAARAKRDPPPRLGPLVRPPRRRGGGGGRSVESRGG
jgi:hypothetical protein